MKKDHRGFNLASGTKRRRVRGMPCVADRSPADEVPPLPQAFPAAS
jgi:hypothetical protein